MTPDSLDWEDGEYRNAHKSRLRGPCAPCRNGGGSRAPSEQRDGVIDSE